MKRSRRTMNRWLRLFVSADDKDFFVENIALLLRAHLGIVDILDAVQEDVKSGTLRKIVRRMRDQVDSGQSFAQAVEQSGLFAEYAVALVRIGEESGQLPENMTLIVEQGRKDREFRARIRSAMMYPAFVLTLTVIVGLGVAWQVLPQLARLADTVDAALPLPTRVLITLGDFFTAYGAIAVPTGIVAALLGLYFFFFQRHTRFIGQWILFHLPGVKKLLQHIELARFGYVIGHLLEAGLPITHAIRSLSEATTFWNYRRMYKQLLSDVEEGISVEESLQRHRRARRLVPRTIRRLIGAAIESGALSETCVSVGRTFEEKSEQSSKNLSVILEPFLLVVVWGGVLLVALAVILPLYGLISNLN